MAEHERTLKMKQKFFELRAQGYSHQQIADEFDLSVSTVRSKIPELSEKSGIPLEECYDFPQKSHPGHIGRNGLVKKIDFTEYRKRYDQIGKEINALRSIINEFLEQNKEEALW